MGVFVDELRVWPHAQGPFRAGSCHMTATTVEELHAFAAGLGLRRAWFQDHRIAAHYDLTPPGREAALRRGAIFVPIREQLRARRRGQAPCEGGTRR